MTGFYCSFYFGPLRILCHKSSTALVFEGRTEDSRCFAASFMDNQYNDHSKSSIQTDKRSTQVILPLDNPDSFSRLTAETNQKKGKVCFPRIVYNQARIISTKPNLSTKYN